MWHLKTILQILTSYKAHSASLFVHHMLAHMHDLSFLQEIMSTWWIWPLFCMKPEASNHLHDPSWPKNTSPSTSNLCPSVHRQYQHQQRPKPISHWWLLVRYRLMINSSVTNQHVYLSPPPGRSCFHRGRSVGWLVCQQDYAKADGWISSKLRGRMGKSSLNVGADPNKGVRTLLLSLNIKYSVFDCLWSFLGEKCMNLDEKIQDWVSCEYLRVNNFVQITKKSLDLLGFYAVHKYCMSVWFLSFIISWLYLSGDHDFICISYRSCKALFRLDGWVILHILFPLSHGTGNDMWTPIPVKCRNTENGPKPVPITCFTSLQHIIKASLLCLQSALHLGIMEKRKNRELVWKLVWAYEQLLSTATWGHSHGRKTQPSMSD